MTVYVESNFVLELTLLQEQHQSCEELLQWAAEGKVRLVIPAFSLAEPYETLIRYAKRRNTVAEELRRELSQLRRSAPYEEQVDPLSDLIALLIQSREEEKGRLQQVLQRLLDVAEVIPLTGDIVSAALQYQADPGLSPQDSIVYASVRTHLSQQDTDQSVFLNRNSKDFDNPDIVGALNSRACKVHFSFDDGVGDIRSQLSL